MNLMTAPEIYTGDFCFCCRRQCRQYGQQRRPARPLWPRLRRERPGRRRYGMDCRSRSPPLRHRYKPPPRPHSLRTATARRRRQAQR